MSNLALLGQSFVLGAICAYLFLIVSSRNLLKLSSFMLWVSYGILTYCFLTNDFSLKVVAENTAPNTPLIYKIVGVWGNGEGSMHLWVCLLSLVGFFLKDSLINQRFFAFHMIGFIILQYLTHNPFALNLSVGFHGDLNPLLQDQSMVLHPPILYIGNILFAYLFYSNIDHKTHPTALPLGFAILTLGITLGSFWAYYELGWGGFWYWDPVEVISLIPWLFYVLGFHLIHKNISPKNLYLFGWPVVLLCFALVRSGLLSSVHSFAENTHFLTYFIIFWVITLIPIVYKKLHFSITINSQKNMILFVLWLGILTILIISLLLPLFNKHIYFGPTFFQASVWPLCLPVLAFMGLYRSPLISPALVGGLFVLWFTMNDPQIPLLGSITLGLTAYGSLSCFLTKQPIFTKISHLGWHMLIASSVLVTFLGTQESFTLKNDETKIMLSEGKTLVLEKVLATQGPNYIGHRAYFNQNNNRIYSPELRHFPISETTHSQMSIHTSLYYQSAVALENMTATTIKATYYYRPFIQGVWLGSFLIIMGTLLWIYRLYSRYVFSLALKELCRKIRLLFENHK